MNPDLDMVILNAQVEDALDADSLALLKAQRERKVAADMRALPEEKLREAVEQSEKSRGVRESLWGPLGGVVGMKRAEIEAWMAEIGRKVLADPGVNDHVGSLMAEVEQLRAQRDHARKIAGRCFRVVENVGLVEPEHYQEPDPHDAWIVEAE